MTWHFSSDSYGPWQIRAVILHYRPTNDPMCLIVLQMGPPPPRVTGFCGGFGLNMVRGGRLLLLVLDWGGWSNYKTRKIIASSLNTGCPKVPWNSNVVLFSAKYGQILKPFGLQIATLGRFDIMYDIPWLPIRCHLLWRITSWAYFWHWQLCGFSDIKYIWFFHPHNCLYSNFCMQNAHKCHLESWNIVEYDKEAR